MKNKSRIRIILIALLVIVISLSVGFGTWIISNNEIKKPVKPGDNASKIITNYLDNRETIFNGNIQLPTPRTFNDYLTLSPNDVTYFYKEKNSNSDYVECVKDKVGPLNAGEYLIQVKYKFTDDNIFTLSDLKFTIKKYTLKLGDTIVGFEECTYNSLEQTPSFTVSIKINDKSFELSENDYTTVYSNNINATSNTSLAKAKSTLKDSCQNFEGTFESNFKIAKRNVNDDLIVYDDLDENELQYTGSEIQPTINLYLALTTNNKIPLLKGTDYSLRYKDNINGPGIIQIQGINNYTGFREVKFEIIGAPKLINLSETIISNIENVVYTGLEQTPNFTVTIENQILVQDTHYTVKYYDNINAGIAKITINSIDGISYNSNEITFIINKANPLITTIPTFNDIYEGAFDNGFPEITNGEAKFNNLPIKGTFKFNGVVTSYNIDGSVKNYYFNNKGTTTSAGFTNYVSYTFTPEDQDNFNSITKSDAKILIKSVAFSGSTYYGSIEHALNAVTSGTINVIASTDEGRIIRTNCTIKSGVTLQFLYSGATTIIEDTTNYYPSKTTHSDRTYALNNLEKRKNLIYINENITLTNNGTIVLGGIISSGGGGGEPNSQTCDSYAEIVLYDQSSIVNNSGSKFINYGAVKDNANENGEIIFNNGSFIQMPFVLIEHRGGTKFMAIYLNQKGASFNRFFFQNLISTVTFNYGSIFQAYANLWASEQDNETKINIVGTSSDYLIQLNNNSYFISKYNNSTFINELNFYGNFQLNSLDMVILERKISTSKILFPITWYFNITLNSIDNNLTTVTLSQNVKIMPGASIKVNKNVELIANKLIVYDTFTDITGSDVGFSGSPYPTNKGHGMLLIYGKFTIQNKGSIGGIITKCSSDAEINIASNASRSITSYEFAGVGFIRAKWNSYSKNLEILNNY